MCTDARPVGECVMHPVMAAGVRALLICVRMRCIMLARATGVRRRSAVHRPAAPQEGQAQHGGHRRAAAALPGHAAHQLPGLCELRQAGAQGMPTRAHTHARTRA